MSGCVKLATIAGAMVAKKTGADGHSESAPRFAGMLHVFLLLFFSLVRCCFCFRFSLVEQFYFMNLFIGSLVACIHPPR